MCMQSSLIVVLLSSTTSTFALRTRYRTSLRYLLWHFHRTCRTLRIAALSKITVVASNFRTHRSESWNISTRWTISCCRCNQAPPTRCNVHVHRGNWDHVACCTCLRLGEPAGPVFTAEGKVVEIGLVESKEALRQRGVELQELVTWHRWRRICACANGSNRHASPVT